MKNWRNLLRIMLRDKKLKKRILTKKYKRKFLIAFNEFRKNER